MDKIILLGAGGHCKSVLDALSQEKKFKIAAILDKNKTGETIFDAQVTGSDDDMADWFAKGVRHCFITVGSSGNPTTRVAVFKKASQLAFQFPCIIHPKAIVSPYAQIGEGSFIAPGAVVNAGSRVGRHCIINTGALVDHDCEIGDFAHIAPGVSLSGGVKIGDYCHIGTGSSVIQQVAIGERTIIGAGSVIIGDVPGGVVCFGNPAREIRKNEE
jgi:sugar O-acyltransferase (sialic acid O-acetyltransferase NeuD family)